MQNAGDDFEKTYYYSMGRGGRREIGNGGEVTGGFTGAWLMKNLAVDE
jgi:hypothetical protein